MDRRYLELAKMIDHSLLNPTLTEQDLQQGIQLAIAYDVASVCIMPYYLAQCTRMLEGTGVLPSTTIGFPHGGNTTAVKCVEAERAIKDGCQELDMVINISQALSGKWDDVRNEIKAIVDLAHDADRRVKVIFENCYLNEEQKIRLCQICSEVNADWVKTSTGYGSSGATHEDLKLMRTHAAEHVQVKAAGGVRDLEGLRAVRAIGVSRCGASRTKDMLDPLRVELGMDPIHITASGSLGY